MAAVIERGPVRRMDRPEPGRWMVKCCRFCPEVAARIWLCDHEPGFPDNKLERPFLQGQIGLDLVSPDEVWQRRGRAISEAAFGAQIAWLRWAERNAPDRAEYTYRKPINIAAIPIPRFQKRV